MGLPLNKSEMLSIVLYTGGESNYSLCKSQRNADFNQWKWFDYCLYWAIAKLSKRECGLYKIYTGLMDTKLDYKHIDNGYFKTYVSTSWVKEIALTFVSGQGMLFEIDEHFRAKSICCDVSWISKFGTNECEILIARSIDAILNSFACDIVDDRDEIQKVYLYNQEADRKQEKQKINFNKQLLSFFPHSNVKTDLFDEKYDTHIEKKQIHINDHFGKDIKEYSKSISDGVFPTKMRNIPPTHQDIIFGYIRSISAMRCDRVPLDVCHLICMLYDYPSTWMEKKKKFQNGWSRRYFVLIGDELLYYQSLNNYQSNKKPKARIVLGNQFIKSFPPVTHRKHAGKTIFKFNICTPTQIYSLRTNRYDNMKFWMKELSRRNERDELIDGLSLLIGESEQAHSTNDEFMMEKFSDLRSVLSDNNAIVAYHRYLQSTYNEEFTLFWMNLSKYCSNYDISSKDVNRRYAVELYETYIQSGAHYQLSNVKSGFTKNVKRQIECGLITKNMFDQIKQCVFSHLDKESYRFFNSSEFFRFIITYKQNDQSKCFWPLQFEDKIEFYNKQKHKHILSSEQGLMYYYHNDVNKLEF
eukprot:303739_1